MTLLVVGADRVDAGKTTFAVGLLARLGATGFKPRAGNDYWFDHGDYRAAVAEGRLYGKDARRLADASAIDVTPEAINPIHRLWRPAPGGDGFLGRADRTFVLDRVGDRYVVNAEAEIPHSAREALPLDDAPRVSSVDELNRAIRAHHLPVLDELRERIEATEPTVVESYGDVARPLRDLAVERVAVVEPGRVRVYDGDRYDTACEVATGSPLDGQLEERVDEVVEPIEPVATVTLPPLTPDERSDPEAIAEAYAAAYDALV